VPRNRPFTVSRALAVGFAVVGVGLVRPAEPEIAVPQGVVGESPHAVGRDVRPRVFRLRPAASSSPARPRAPSRRGELVVVPATGRTIGTGAVKLFAMEVEGGLRIDRATFARVVVRTLADRRSWAARDGFALRWVDSGRVDLRIAVASPALTDRLCAPLQTNGIYSCATPARAVLNAGRWQHGAASYRGRTPAYRRYLVNHEVGHLFGRGHVACLGPGERAPVMMQQTKGVGSCVPNPWPLAWE
jgi:Protein of unknown function (DUF3152)